MAMGEKAAPRRLVPGGPCVCVEGGESLFEARE